MFAGRLIMESLSVGARLDTPGLQVSGIVRVAVGSPTSQQATIWSILDFTGPDELVEKFTADLSAALDPHGHWYADFNAGPEHVVVFAGRVFRYPNGDAEGRSAAVAHGQSLGIPEEQLDWVEQKA